MCEANTFTEIVMQVLLPKICEGINGSMHYNFTYLSYEQGDVVLVQPRYVLSRKYYSA